MCSNGAVPRCIVDLTGYYLDLVLKETCSDCPVCAGQLQAARSVLGLMGRGEGKDGFLEELRALAGEAARLAECGVGRIGAGIITGALENYDEELEAHFKERYCPAGVCDIRYAVEV
jgi:NADH:ubiquinone oxidoreductase subunit F (NADH-binding)